MVSSAEPKGDQLFKALMELDRKRATDPLAGRHADAAMIAFCQFLKDERAALGEAATKRLVDKLRSMNLRPYWNYCREHMLDVGLEF